MPPQRSLLRYLRSFRTIITTALSTPAVPAAAYEPSAASLARRTQFAQRLSDLKDVWPHSPFYKLRAHRVPTLWTLYRGLLRLAPSDAVCLRVRRAFERHRNLTSPRLTKTQLEKGHRMLEHFKLAASGDARAQAVAERYARFVALRFEKGHMAKLARDEIQWRDRLATRPILTGGFMRPTLFNGPLPRMKRQPEHVTGMIVSRLRARTQRSARQLELFTWVEDVHAEARFEAALLKGGSASDPRRSRTFEPVFAGHEAEWQQVLQEELQQTFDAFARDEARKRLPYPPAMLKQIREAKRERVRNKRNELAREKRGERTLSMRIRKRKNYPVGAMVNWSEQRKQDMLLVRRNISEVGYVGEVKRRMGWKIGQSEDVLEGEEKERVERMEKEFEEASERRMRILEGKEKSS